ncbi:MAG: TonB-dependent receptor [Chitinophagaceae bacterium]
MRFFLSILFIIIFITQAKSQIDPETQRGADINALQIKTTRLFGKLTDLKTKKGVEAASVQLFIAKNDSLVGGMLTKPNGDFSFSNIPSADSFTVAISAIGYEPRKQTVKTVILNKNAVAKYEKDLGNIVLTPAVKQLENVTVTAKTPALEMGIDRKTFNVAKSLTATGGSAIDVMKNIPSVSVDIDGNVKLRNASPQIFVDGRPSILTLDQIPADNIEKVELITNPSAKYDAATSGGIINVVLKKNKRNGLNGIASVSVGSPSVANGNLNLNLRQGKVNLFIIGGYNQGGGKNKGETKRENRSNGITQDYFNQLSVNDRVRRFRSLRFGVDFFMDNRNTISVIQDLGAGRFTNNETQNQEYLNSNKIQQYTGERFSEGRFGFNRNSTRVNYKHSFPEAGKELTADLTYNYGSRSDNSNILNNFMDPNGSIYKPSTHVRNNGNSHNNQFTFQADYVYPKGDDTKFETGIRSYQNKFSSYYNAFSVDNAGETKLPLSNNYDYTENIHAIYATYSKKYGGFSYQLGLRAEYAKFTGNLVDSAFKFGYEYPAGIKNTWNALFPSLFLTQKINDKDQVQLNFSRRIRRPDFWQLNPFIDISDPVNLRQGNPQLKPEFINSFEVNYSKTYTSGNFLGVLYLHNNPADITQYSDTITAEQYTHLASAGVDPNAILNTFINGSVTNRWGAEFTVQQKLGNNFDITPTANFQYRTVKAAVNGLDLSNNGFNWMGKLIVNYKIVTKKYPLFNNLSFQLSGDYESPEVIPQGKTKSEFDSDFAMRKDFLKNNKATITFGINDIFNTQRWGNIYDTPSFYQDSYRRWSIRTFRISFSYKFGKADFSLLNRKDKSNDD